MGLGLIVCGATLDWYVKRRKDSDGLTVPEARLMC